MVAELGGGRETAMLAGGAAGIPAWWMAFNSLSLSIFSLLIAYPIMYKVYHQEADDILSRNHIIRLVEDIISKCERRLGISIDHELAKVEPRDLSIDIMVPYKNTENTLSDSKTIRDEILREVLDEFALFHVFKPVQLTVRTIGSNQAIDFDSGVGIGVGDRDDEEAPENYTSFFEELHSLSRVEDEVRDSLDLFFVRDNTLKLENAVITSVVPLEEANLVLTGSKEAYIKEEEIVQDAEKEFDADANIDYVKTPSINDRSEPPLGDLPLLKVPDVWQSKLSNDINIDINQIILFFCYKRNSHIYLTLLEVRRYSNNFLFPSKQELPMNH